MEVFSGRPADCAGRDAVEQRSYDLLDRLGIEYLRADHPAALTMEDCVSIGQALDAPVCKNLFLCNRQKTCYYLLLMEGDKPFKTKDLSAQLEIARLSFADEEAMDRLLGVRPGSVSPLGLENDRDKRVQLVIDRALLAHPRIGCHPCRNTSTVGFSTEDFIHKLLPALGHPPAYVRL